MAWREAYKWVEMRIDGSGNERYFNLRISLLDVNFLFLYAIFNKNFVSKRSVNL